jgi:hypothetical protein
MKRWKMGDIALEISRRDAECSAQKPAVTENRKRSARRTQESEISRENSESRTELDKKR